MKDKQDIIVGVRHTEYSATMLCWIYCFGREFTPTAVKYIDAFDCWKNQDKATWENVIMPLELGLIPRCGIALEITNEIEGGLTNDI